jgi:putative ABC transport system permease protein
MGPSSLLVHKLRSLLTMLGMIFGEAVVAMLPSWPASKRDAGDDRPIGVNNIIIEARWLATQ